MTRKRGNNVEERIMQQPLNSTPAWRKRLNKWCRSVVDNRWLYLLILPALVYLIIFNYLPMYGVQIAFKNYKAVRGIAGSDWVGFKHFETFFNAYYCGRLISNTLLLNVLSLLFSFPIPIVLAVIVNNIRNQKLKKQPIIFTMVCKEHHKKLKEHFMMSKIRQATKLR